MRNAFLSLVLVAAAIVAHPASAQDTNSEAPTANMQFVSKTIVQPLAAVPAPAPIPAKAAAQPSSSGTSELTQLRAEVAAQRASITQQISALQAQQSQLDTMERRLALALGETPTPKPIRAAAAPNPTGPVQRVAAAPTGAPQSASAAAAQGTVGVAPEDADRQPEVAALGRQGSAITKKGKISGEVAWSYARADRNRAVFRGVEVVESVLVGTFDINESRQDVFTQKVGLQYGLTDDIEIGIDVPFVARWNTSILAPVAGPAANGETREIDNSANGYGVGDVEIQLRKQLHAPRGFGAYVIGNVQVAIPTGEGPFSLERNQFGEASEAATGSGFWGATAGLTAIVPSDPGVLFGSLSYTKNFARDVDAVLPPVRIERVDPGDALSFSAGVGLALNPRLSLNFGYAHSWGFGTQTTTRALTEGAEATEQTSRDLQIGRFLFGTTYKMTPKTSLNFGIEAGLTDDATDLRMVLRIPFVL